MNQPWLKKEKKTWFKIIKKGIVLHCAALMIGGGLMIATPLPAMADFTIAAGTTETTTQFLDLNNEVGTVEATGVLDVTDASAVSINGSKYGQTLDNAGTISSTMDYSGVTTISGGDLGSVTITNSGTIVAESIYTDTYYNNTADVTAIGVTSFDGSSSVTNSGMIRAETIGYDFSDATAINVSGTNLGVIENTTGYILAHTGLTGDATSIEVTGNQGDIINSGIILAETVTLDPYVNDGGDAYGIYVGENTSAGTIENTSTGSITASAEGRDVASFGILVENHNDGTITNSGTISSSTLGDGTHASGIAVYLNYGEITNDGSLSSTANGKYGSAAGIEVYGNTGTISNVANDLVTGVITVTNNSSDPNATVGIFAQTNSGTILNSGIIGVSTTGYGYGTYTAGIYVANDNNGSLLNSGDITVSDTGAGEDRAVAGIFGGNVNYGIIVNGGSIDVTMSSNAYWGTEAFGIITDYNLYGIQNAGGITVNNYADASIAAGINVAGNSGGDIINSGDIDVTVTGEDSDAAGIYAENANYGTITNALDSTITVTAQGDYSGARAIAVHINSGLIDNSGTLTVSTSGVQSDAVGIYSYYTTGEDAIRNSGTLSVATSGSSADAYGILVKDGDANEVTNSGSLSVSHTGYAYDSDIAGIRINGDAYSVTNSGTLSVSVANAYDADIKGIFVDGTNYGTVENSGTLSVTVSVGYDNYAGGMIVYGNEGTVENSGSLTVSTGDYGVALGMFTRYGGGDVSNSGTIDVSGDGAFGIFVGEDWGSLVNEEGGEITVSGQFAAGMVSKYNMYGTSIENHGTITVSHEAGDLGEDWTFGIMTESQEGTDIVNTGTIDITGSAEGFAAGIVNFNYGIDGSVSNSGTISVKSDGYAIGIMDGFYSGYDSIDTIYNSGTIEGVDSTGELSEYGFAIFAQSAAVTNTETGVLRGTLNVDYLDNAGLIELPKTDSYVANYFTQTATGTLGISLYNDDDAENGYNIDYSTLHVLESAILENGTTLDVNVQTLVENQGFIVDTVLDGVIQTDTGIAVDLEQLNVTDNSALLGFTAQLSNEDTWLDLAVYQDLSILEATQNSGRTGVYGAAGTLDELTDSDDPEIGEFIGELFGLETDGEVADRVEQASPGHITSLPKVNEQMFHTFNSIVQARMNSMRGFNSGDIAFRDNNLWAKPFASRAEQDDDNGINGYDARSYGIGVGADGEYGAGNRFGMAMFYTRTNVDTNDVRQEADMDTVNLLAYGSNPIIDDSMELFYQLGFGLQQVDTSRYISALDAKASGDYTAKSLYAEVKGSKTLQLTDTLESMLGLSLAYTYYDSPSYHETGAGGMNLYVDSFDSDSLIVEAQGDFTYSLTKNMELMASLGLGYDLIDDDVTVNSSFEGASSLVFSTDGVDTSPVVYTAGVGMAQKLTDDLNVDLKYDMEGRGSDYTNHMVSAKINWKF